MTTLEPLELTMIGISAGLALLVLVLALVIVRRTGRRADERLAAAVSDMNARMETMVQDLSYALVRAEEESRRSRIVGELAGTIDLDQVLEHTLEAAVEVGRADAALVHLTDLAEERPVVATLGLSVEEAQRHGVVSGPPDGRVARSVSFAYRYSEDQEAADGTLIRAGLAVPMGVEEESVGHLAVFSRNGSGDFGDDTVDALEELARRAAPAIENARRFQEARQLADLDALTGLHNRRYFHETLGREVARAHRYGRRLALVVLDLDDFKAVNDRIGHLAGDAVLAEAADRMRGAVRSADVTCRVGGDEFAVILPESNITDADQLCRRIQHAVSSSALGQAGSLFVSAGVAELQPDEDSRTFFERADDALYRAKESGRGRLVEADLSSG